MTYVFQLIFYLSIISAVLISVIYLIRFIGKNRINNICKYYLWIVVIVQLFSPFILNLDWFSNLNLKPNFFKHHTDIEFKTTETSYTPDLHQFEVDSESKAILDKATSTTYSHNNIESKKDYQIEFNTLISLIWFTISCFILSFTIIKYILTVLDLKKTSYSAKNQNIVEVYNECVTLLNLKTSPILLFNNKISSPMLIGVFKPIVLMPDKEFDNLDLKFSFTHELIHYRRKDLVYKWIVEILKSLHFFNPFIYLMSKSIAQDCEITCDEEVINLLGDDLAVEYGEMLINTAIDTSKSIKLTTHMSCNKKNLRRRVENMINFVPKTSKTKFVLASLTLALTTLSLTIGAMANSLINNDYKENDNFDRTELTEHNISNLNTTSLGDESSNSKIISAYPYKVNSSYLDSEFGDNIERQYGLISTEVTKMVKSANDADLYSLANLAPYLDKETLNKAVNKIIESSNDIELYALGNLVDYLDKATISKAVNKALESPDNMNLYALGNLVDYLDKATINKAVNKAIESSKNIDLYSVANLADYLDKDTINRAVNKIIETSKDIDLYSLGNLVDYLDKATINKAVNKVIESSKNIDLYSLGNLVDYIDKETLNKAVNKAIENP